MIEMTKEIRAGVIGKRQWWTLSSGTAVVAYGNEGCGISVCDSEDRDVTVAVAEKLSAAGVRLDVIPTIDTILIICSEGDIRRTLSDINDVLKRLESPGHNTQ